MKHGTAQRVISMEIRKAFGKESWTDRQPHQSRRMAEMDDLVILGDGRRARLVRLPRHGQQALVKIEGEGTVIALADFEMTRAFRDGED
jgi:hypothetical protein